MAALRRSLLFATFLLSCAAVALLLAALGTRHWVVANAKRARNPLESDGYVHFGLFAGRKELNVAYGWRTYEIDVIDHLRHEPGFMLYGFWLGTVTAVCLGVLFSGLAAVFAAVNTATTAHALLTNVSGLYVWNFLACACDVCAAGCWLGQFYLKLQHSVLSEEDKRNEWSSENMAELGFSFWFVVGAAAATFVNILAVFIATIEKKDDTIIPVIEEKTNGAIMLY